MSSDLAIVPASRKMVSDLKVGQDIMMSLETQGVRGQAQKYAMFIGIFTALALVIVMAVMIATPGGII